MCLAVCVYVCVCVCVRALSHECYYTQREQEHPSTEDHLASGASECSALTFPALQVRIHAVRDSHEEDMCKANTQKLIIGIPPLGSVFFQTGVRRRKYKLGPTKQKSVPGISSLARVYISSSSPHSERMPLPGGGFLRSTLSLPSGLWHCGIYRKCHKVDEQ